MFLFVFNFNMKTHSNLINKIQCEFNSIQTSRTPAVGIDKSRTWNLIEWENNRHTSELFCGLQYISNGLIWMWSLFPPCSDGSSIELCGGKKHFGSRFNLLSSEFYGRNEMNISLVLLNSRTKDTHENHSDISKTFYAVSMLMHSNEKSKLKKPSQYFRNSVFSILLLVITILRVECIKSHIWLLL